LRIRSWRSSALSSSISTTRSAAGSPRSDPAGLNRLLTDNQRLRGLVEEITAKLNRVAGLGVIEISDRAVQIHDASQPRRCKQTPRGSSRYAPG
jgi:hypothetical protein